MFGRSIATVLVISALCQSLVWTATLKHADANKGPCTCGLFGQTLLTDEKHTPLISKSYLNVTCDETGRTNCANLCISLANASREKATAALCQNMEHAKDLSASLFTQTCNEKWVYSGITAPEPICCHDKKIITCGATK